jgi:hypothetical protein
VWLLCYKKRHDHEWLSALESLGGHLMAFAGIVAFANMMFSCWFQKHVYMPAAGTFDMQSHVLRLKYVFVIVLVVVMLLLLFGLSRMAREKREENKPRQPVSNGEEKKPLSGGAHGTETHTETQHTETHTETHHKRWIDEVSGAENEAAALIIGFLVLQASVLFVTGKQPGLHDHSCRDEVELTAILWLFGVGTFCLLIMAAVSMVKAHLQTETPHKVPNFNFRKSMAMSAGWCMERSSKWLMIYWWDDAEVASVSSAFLVSLLTVIAVLIVGKIHKSTNPSKARERVMEDLLESFAVLVGLGWDHAFQSCQTTMIDHYDKSAAGGHRMEEFQRLTVHALVKAVMAVILCTMVAPGWVWYLLPAAQKPNELET